MDWNLFRRKRRLWLWPIHPNEPLFERFFSLQLQRQWLAWRFDGRGSDSGRPYCFGIGGRHRLDQHYRLIEWHHKFQRGPDWLSDVVLHPLIREYRKSTGWLCAGQLAALRDRRVGRDKRKI